MKLASNSDGSEALILGLNEVSEATRLETNVVLQLYARGLFPDPLHHHPPLWSANAIAEWVKSATSASMVTDTIPAARAKKARRAK